VEEIEGMELPTAADTRAFGERLAGLLRAGDLVVLTGPLGAGKTVIAQGVGAGLGVRGEVTSPTFVIARVHPGPRVPLVHVDAYRLGAVSDPVGEVDALDLDASVDESVTLVEWGADVAGQLTDAFLEIRLERRDDDTRVATLLPRGADWVRRIEALAG
jgi:tRNA threonylcarbamoyladenosine biosynthesis protein TsaE